MFDDLGTRLLLQPVALAQAGQHFVCDTLGLLAGGFWIPVESIDEDDEFVATKTSHGVAFPDTTVQASRNFLQQQIAQGMAMAVVERLEIVEVKEQHAAIATFTAQAAQLAVEAVVQQAAVG